MTSFGPYVVEAELARGAAGVVFRARDPNDATGTAVAIKVLLRRPGQEGRAARRMEREMRVLERLRHPAIVSVRATGEAPNGALWIAMDLVEGRSLQERLDHEGPLPVREAASLLLELARALAHAHAEGVLHRDLKPANVLLDRAGRPFLADFGLAKDLGGTLHGQSLSTSGQFLGTPGYWPPEQARGEHGKIGRASDVYGLGALLYAMLTGEPPSGHSDSLIEAMAAVEREPPPPSRLRPDVPAALDAICARCLRRSPAERYESAEDVAAAVQGWLGARRGRGRARRRVTPVAAGVALLLVAAAGGALAVRPATDGEPAPSTETAVAPVPSGPLTSPLGLAADELARLMAAGDSTAALAFIDALPPELQANEQVTLSRALTCLELGLRGVTGGSRPEGEALLERAVDLGRGSTDPDVQLVGARALSALGRHDEAIAAFTPLLQAPGDLGAPLLHGALTAAERAFPEASRSFFSPSLSEAAETLRAARHLNSVVDVPADDAAPRDRARAYVALARALHASQVMVSPDALDTAVSLAPDDPHARLARAERGLARGAAALDGVEVDLRVVHDQAATLTPEASARLGVLSTLLQAERLHARGDPVEATAQLRGLLALATANDEWSRAAAGFARARRAAALNLPTLTEDRLLTPEELARLAEAAPPFVERGRADLFLEVLEELPPRARTQPLVARGRAVMHLSLADAAAQARRRDEARGHRERALALTTPPLEPADRVVRGDALRGLDRWSEAVAEYDEALRGDSTLAGRVLESGLQVARNAFPKETWASFLVPGPRADSRAEQVVAFLEALLPTGAPSSVARTKAHLHLARARHALGDAAGAEGALRLAAEGRPDNGQLRLTRGEWHLSRGRLDEAEEDLRAASVGEENQERRRMLQQALAAERALAANDPTACLREVDDLDPRLRRLNAADHWERDFVVYLRALRERAVQAGGGGG